MRGGKDNPRRVEAEKREKELLHQKAKAMELKAKEKELKASKPKEKKKLLTNTQDMLKILEGITQGQEEKKASELERKNQYAQKLLEKRAGKEKKKEAKKQRLDEIKQELRSKKKSS